MARAGRILIVDDEQAIRELLVGALMDEGYEIRTCERGADALDLLRTWRPDLTLLDLQLTDMGGDAYVEACRQQGLPMGQVFLLSAAVGLDDVAARLAVSGAVGKPFDLDALIEMIQEALAE